MSGRQKVPPPVPTIEAPGHMFAPSLLTLPSLVSIPCFPGMEGYKSRNQACLGTKRREFLLVCGAWPSLGALGEADLGLLSGL